MKKFLFLFSVVLLLSCQNKVNNTNDPNSLAAFAQKKNLSAKIVLPEDPNMIKTLKGANELDLEAPLRCSVNWQTQPMISTIPYNVKAFSMIRNGPNDALPRFEVTGFSFETMPASSALKKLIKEADIKLIAKDGPYAKISAENLRGEFSEVITMITDAAELYYSYDAHNKTLKISRKANWTLYVPRSRPIILGLLDVLRGAGITDITTDWSDYSITFEADVELRNKITTLINYFEENPILIAFDVSVFRIYPNNPNIGVNWQELMKNFDFGTVKTAKTGVIGRVLTTSNEINLSTLQSFLSNQAKVIPVSQGKFIVPNLWLARFDVGKCGNPKAVESDLSILAKASFERNNKIFSNITLDTTKGELTQFSIRSELGENFLIIGIPNEVLGSSIPNSETVVFMVPRIIRTTKTTKHLENNL